MPLSFLFTRPARAARFGELQPDPDGIFDLPPGFRYAIVDQFGDAMSDGRGVPGRPDGMDCFSGDAGTVILMRNHELYPSQGYLAGWVETDVPEPAFDRRSHGCVTRVVLDGDTYERRSSNVVLSGTNRNCSGGRSPWGWLSCEEDVAPGHGYVFLCPTDADGPRAPRRIASYGRFRHEAAVVDPQTNIAYLTEDQPDGALYRFVPRRRERPFEGTLEALAVRGQPGFDTTELGPGVALPVDWVPIEEPDPRDDVVRVEAHRKGAAYVERGEGIVLSGRVAHVCSTSGGPASAGQVFTLDLDRGELSLLAASTQSYVLDMPDNIAVAPWGDVLVAEDGGGEDFLRGITPEGQVYDFARNRRSSGELAGVCFAPRGDAMFVNLQEDGLTLLVRGPFPA